MTRLITRLGHDSPPAGDELGSLLALYAWLNPEDAPLETGSAERIWQSMRNSEHLYCFGLWVDGRLVSTCLLGITPNLTRGGRPFGLIENVVTDPDHRNKGLGTRILHHAIDQAAELGCYKVMLMTGRSDAATLRFFTDRPASIPTASMLS